MYSTKPGSYALLCGILSTLATVAITVSMIASHGYYSYSWLSRELQESLDNTQNHLQLVQRQRDELSIAMNQQSKEYHQYQCNQTAKRIGPNGGWCFGGYPRDKALAFAITELCHGDTVASFGDGNGSYKKLIDETGKIQVYDSFDGAPFCENITGGLVKYLDLSIPVFGLRLYDWVISLEVGEHIPKEYEQIFLDNLVRHARKGIVLSWAVPDQGGRGHVNCQPLEYVVKQLDQRGFDHDKKSSYKLQEVSTLAWLRRNTNVYRRKPEQDANIIII